MPMRPITAVVPVPRKVLLGDEECFAGEFRIADIAAMQAWLDDRKPNPLDAIRAELEGLAPKLARPMLREAYSACESWPPRLGTDAAAEAMACAEAVCLTIYLTLCRYTPGLTGARSVDLAGRLLPGQYATLCRIAYGASAEAEIEALLGFRPDGPRREIDWCLAIDEVSRERHWTYEYIYTLTLSEFGNARCHGKALSRGMAVQDGETMAQAQERVRKIMYDDPE